MVTSVGFGAAASCAAIRVGISGAEETRFMFDGEWLMGCAVPLEQGWRGREQLLRMVVPAIQECVALLGATPVQQVPLLLCVAEPDRPGRFANLDSSFLRAVQDRLGQATAPDSAVIAGGRIGPVQAIVQADRLISAGRPCCIVAAVDTLLTAPTLNHYHERGRLLTAENSNGFIPGEAAAAFLLARADDQSLPQLRCVGLGTGTEKVTVDAEEPLRADGMAEAIKSALADGHCTYSDLHYRIADVNGEQYAFKEMALAESRTLRERKEEFDIWHPAECVGEVGAAIVPVVLGVALAASRKEYAPGPGVLCHFAGEGTERAALILRYMGRAA
jgi:3-oxoacyl-[acyl-carrier-protein] synthase-1